MTEKEKRAEAYAEERELRRYGTRAEVTAVCANCEHFIRHYVIVGEDKIRIIPIGRGHCVFPRLKDRKETDFCDHYKQVSFPGLPDAYEFESLIPFKRKF